MRLVYVCVVSFVPQSSGCLQQVSASDLDRDPSDLAMEYSDAQFQSSIAPPYERIKSFGQRWVSFWSKFVAASSVNGTLYDDHLFDAVLSPWLKAVASSKVRAWRRMATMATFAIISELNEVSLRNMQRSDVIEQQLSDKKIGKAAAGLHKEQTALSEQLDAIHRIADGLFNESEAHKQTRT